MDEAAPPLAAGEEQAALETLRFDWGIHYSIGHDNPFGWWAARRGKAGASLITEDGPAGLRTAIEADFGPAKP